MGKPDPKDDAIIIESYARWAGDVLFARESLELAVATLLERPVVDVLSEQVGVPISIERQIARDANELDRVPRALVEWGQYRKKRIDNERVSQRELTYRESIEQAESIEQQSLDNKPSSPFIQGRNLRAVVSVVNTREFELRAYPTNLNMVEEILSRAKKAEQKFSAAGRIERDVTTGSKPNAAKMLFDKGDAPKVIKASGATWTMPGRLLRFVWVDAFALILVRAVWTADEPFESSNTVEAYNHFREILRLLD